jgi:ketosteroid isomerase-like protein
MRLPRLVPLLIALAAAPAFAQAPATAAVPAPVQDLLRQYERAWKAKDAPALAALFTADGLALPNGRPPATGRAAIEAEYAQNAGSDLLLRPIAFAESGELATVVGMFRLAPAQPELGKFVLVLRRQADGTWRVVADIDNLNVVPRARP